MALASVGLLWVKEDLDLGGKSSPGGGCLLLGAWQERHRSPPSVDSAASPQCPSLGVPPPTSVSASHLFLWAFLFHYLFLSHEMCLEEPSSDHG